MTVRELIKVLSLIDENKVVILSEPNQIGWTNIGKVVEEQCRVKIVEDDSDLFDSYDKTLGLGYSNEQREKM